EAAADGIAPGCGVGAVEVAQAEAEEAQTAGPEQVAACHLVAQFLGGAQDPQHGILPPAGLCMVAWDGGQRSFIPHHAKEWSGLPQVPVRKRRICGRLMLRPRLRFRADSAKQ